MKYRFANIVLSCLSLLLLVSACQEDISPASSGTFVKFYGNFNDNEAIDFLQKADGGYWILGNETGNGTDTTILLIQTDRLGDATTRVVLGDSVKAASFLIDSNQEIFILGEKTGNNGTKDFIFFHLDQTAQLVGTPQTFGGINTNERPAELIQLADGNFAALGHTDSVGTNFDMLVVKMDASFQPIWSKVYGILGDVDDFGVSMREDLNGDLIWLGNIQRGTGERNTRLVRSNAYGDILKDEKFINGRMEVASDLNSLPGELVVTGTILNGTQSQILLKRTDLQFNLLSDGLAVQEGGTSQAGSSVHFTRDDSYIIGGSASVNGTDNVDMLLLVMDQNGTELLRNTFGGLLTGISEQDNGVQAIQSYDGGFAFLGLITFGNNKMISLVKTDANGQLDR